jgi:hypothetical protein
MDKIRLQDEGGVNRILGQIQYQYSPASAATSPIFSSP